MINHHQVTTIWENIVGTYSFRIEEAVSKDEGLTKVAGRGYVFFLKKDRSQGLMFWCNFFVNDVFRFSADIYCKA